MSAERQALGIARRWTWRTATVAAALAAAWAWWTWGGWIRVVPPGAAPAAPPATFVDPAGARIRLEDHRGRIVVLNLWASWCGPCVREIPALGDVAERRRDDGVVVLGINAEDVATEALSAMAERLGIRYPVVHLAAPVGAPLTTRGVLPHTWIVDREGRVRASHAGAVTATALDRAVRSLLEEG